MKPAETSKHPRQQEALDECLRGLEHMQTLSLQLRLLKALEVGFWAWEYHT